MFVATLWESNRCILNFIFFFSTTHHQHQLVACTSAESYASSAGQRSYADLPSTLHFKLVLTPVHLLFFQVIRTVLNNIYTDASIKALRDRRSVNTQTFSSTPQHTFKIIQTFVDIFTDANKGCLYPGISHRRNIKRKPIQ